MDRRRFLLTSLFGVLVGPPVVTAQPAGRIPRIGWLTSSTVHAPNVNAFQEGMRSLGYAEIRLDVRAADGRTERLAALAAELLALKVDVIITDGGPAATAAKEATTTTPIVIGAATTDFVVQQKIVASLARPGANITGFTISTGPELGGKRLELLREAVPYLSRVLVIWNPTNDGARMALPAIELAARVFKTQVQLLAASDIAELERRLREAGAKSETAMLTVADAFLWGQRRHIIALAARYQLPAMYPEPEFAMDGGLMAYGSTVSENFRRAAGYVDRILKGQTCRSSRRAADKVPARDQSQGRPDARPDDPAVSAGAGRSGDRIVDRRCFLLTSLAGALAAPLAAKAQQAGKSYMISFLALTPGEDTTSMKALVERLHELSYSEGRNMTFEYRSAEGLPERLPQVARELVRARPDVLIAGFGTLTAQAAKAATATIPIVFTTVGDPVGAGVVASLARPGGNATGLSGLTEIGGKRLELLQELIPRNKAVAVLMNPDTPFTRLALKEVKTAADGERIRLEVLEARTPDQVSGRFEAAIKAGAGGVLVLEDPLMYDLRRQISDLAAKFRLPAVYTYRDYAQAGGLMSYGTDRRQIYRRAAEYVDKILKGAKPADLPVEQPTKFELVINLKTAKALGLTIPPSLLARADQVIDP